MSNNIPEAAALAKAKAAASGTNSPPSLDGTPHAGPDPANITYTMHASQLQTMLRMYERIQTYIFRLMATDSVPKVRQLPSFLSLSSQLV